MAETPKWRRYLRFFGSDVAADVADELQFHLDSKTEELIAIGWLPHLARQEAHRQFGDTQTVRRICQSEAEGRKQKMKNLERLVAFFHDVRYGGLQLRHNAGTTLLAVVTLGIGMGAVTAAFSIVYAVVLRPLPFPHPEQLVSVWSTRGGVDDVVTPRNFDSLRRQARSFSSLGAMQPTTFTLSRSGIASQIPGGFASVDFLKAFGTSPELGRTFGPEEDRPPRLHVAVLSRRLWQEQFHADRSVLGKQIVLNQEPFTIIGVMPASFSVRPGSEEVWAPLALSGQEMTWAGGILNVVGRLRPQATLQQAQSEADLLARRLQDLYPEMNHNRGLRLHDYASDLIGDYRSRLFILLGAVGFVLLIACANVANLLLAKTAGRSQELAVRAALGASRLRVVRQLLTESFLVGFLGAAAGLALAAIFVTIIRKLSLDVVPRLNQATVSVPIFFFAFGLALLSTLLAGLLPALRAAQVDIQGVLRRGGRSASGLARDSARSLYIAAEVALALVLLVGAGLLIRTAVAAEHTSPGFFATNVVSGRTALPPTVYANAGQIVSAYGRILEELRSETGVVSAALTSKVPLSINTVGLVLKQHSLPSLATQDLSTELQYISDGYLSTMKIPLLAGREFDRHDGLKSAQVLLISNALAQRLWPHQRAVGQMLRIPELEGRSQDWNIVGVVGDVRANGLMSSPPAVVYISYAQTAKNPWHWIEQSLYLVARTQSPPLNAAGTLKKALVANDAGLPLSDVRTMDQRLQRSSTIARFYTFVLAMLGGCGLLLAMAGVYGVVAYYVSRQRAEFGIRMALGSSQAQVLQLVLRRGMRPVLAGVGIGLLMVLPTTRLLAAQLYGVTATDPVTLLSVVSFLIAVAAFACYLPAREAARVDPMVALRSE